MKYYKKESSTLEFKQQVPSNDQIVKTIIGFCNRHGGSLILGVADDGTVVGVDPDQADTMLEYLNQTIYEATTPPILPSIYLRQLMGKTLLIIEVSSGMTKPYYYRSKGMAEGTYVRLGRSTLRANPEMIEELKWSSHARTYEASPLYDADMNDLNMNKFQNFLRLRQQNKNAELSTEITDEILRSYNITTKEHEIVYPTVAGILTFCEEPQRYLTEAMILCNNFSGLSGRNSIAARDCNGTLFEQFDAAYQFVLGQLNYSFKIEGPKREEKLEVPRIAIREALLNAVVHRNYHIPAPTKVAIYENRIEIFSPGDFAGPLNSTDLRQGITFLRNPAICKLFREAGYIEKLGTGLISILDSYEAYGLPKPEIIEGENYIKYILPRAGLFIREKSIPPMEDHPILRLFYTADELSIADIIDVLHLSRATAGRQLATLVKLGLIIKIGKGRSIRYKLATRYVI